MSLKKDDVVELVEKDENGWWLVKKDGVEGWAPHNYLELVQPQAAAPSAPTLPPRKVAAPKPVTPTASVANPSAKPVAVFPGMTAANGTAAPWKKNVSASDDSNSRPSSVVGTKPAPAPPAGNKPRPTPPPVGGAKPKPPIPTAPRPAVGGGAKPAGAPKPLAGGGIGQMDLAAAVSFYFLKLSRSIMLMILAAGKEGAAHERRLRTMLLIFRFESYGRLMYLRFSW